jgi:hypothetical protein
MEKKTDNEREAPISIRIPRHLRETFLRKWEASGYSKNGYILKCIFGANAPRATHTPPFQKEQLALILATLAAMRDRLDDVAARVPDDASVAEATNAIGEDLVLLRTAVMKMLGRQP